MRTHCCPPPSPPYSSSLH
ncbi:hypothetical protein O3G_MSEX009404 [Manduca sexta]|nr:hypothetical protein O3G_MSEX009404 [Manduca sexta]